MSRLSLEFTQASITIHLMRPLPFLTDEYYHVYNRGVDKRKIFLGFGHYRRLCLTIKRILDTGSATPRLISRQGLALKSKIEIIAYCLMPNHYHFLLRQHSERGITEFMHKLDTSYTMFFNLNQKRTGRLFEYTFKAKHVPTDELFLHVARYIHLNPVITGIVETVDLWPWSSYLSTIGKRTDDICSGERILAYFPAADSRRRYELFVKDQRVYAQLLHDAQEAKDEDALFL